MKRTESTKNQSNKRPRRSLRIGQQQFGPFWTENTNDAPSVSLTVSNTSSVDRLTNLPELVVDHQLISFMGIVEVAMMREVNRYFEPFWRRRFVDHNLLPICIPYDFPTMETAMRAIEILSKEYTKASPLVVELDKGEHQILSRWLPPGIIRAGNGANNLGIKCNNITIVGKGIGETTILGGIGSHNKKNITLKHLSLTNPIGNGIQLFGAEVELVNVNVYDCRFSGLDIESLDSGPSKLVAKQCEISNNGTGVFSNIDNGSAYNNSCLTDCVIHSNKGNGISANGTGEINLFGGSTAIHSNGDNGIYAKNSCKVLLHLPSHHNTSYNNEARDRKTSSGGTITNVE